VREQTRSHIIDLVLINEPILLSSLSTKPMFSSNDHNSINFTITFDYLESVSLQSPQLR